MDEAQLSAIEATDLFDDYNDINITDFLQQHQWAGRIVTSSLWRQRASTYMNLRDRAQHSAVRTCLTTSKRTLDSLHL